jgi:plastocyanin
MTTIRILLGAGLATGLLFGATPAPAQMGAAPSPHLIVIKLIERAGNPIPFAFEPATFAAEQGDTLQFVQFANTMHNVHFKILPKGARLGSAAVSQYLTAKGESYRVIVDSRFVAGSYEIICDPHELLGMHAMLTVVGSTASR